jgi:AcrR family transcriptional regulator
MLFASSGFRTSLSDISDASGILPGSLYHHFDSKEAIIVELVHRYHDDLDRIAKEALDTLHEPVPRPAEDRIIDFGRAIAGCGVQHRAALLLTLYEPPMAAGEELAGLAMQTPSGIHAAMLELLRAGRASGAIRSGIDLALLADRLCQSMLHVGVGVSHMTPGGGSVPDMRIRILLKGVARRSPTDAMLDRSNALRAAHQVIGGWEDRVGDGDDRLAHLMAVARSEFGRRGYEATTMRDIATEAKLSTGTVYRLLGSKDQLLFSIMSSYSDKVVAAWDAVVR